MDGAGFKNNILRTNKIPSPKDLGVNSTTTATTGNGDHWTKPALLTKGKTKPSPPFRPCGRGAMQLSKAISQSQSKSVLSNSSSESNPTNWVFCFGSPPCYAKVLAFPSNNSESVYIQPMKQSPFDKKLLTLWEGHTWLAKQNKLIPVEMVQKPGGWQVVNDSRVQKIIDMVDNKGCAFAYPTNINHAANTGIDKCDMISLESSEVGEMKVVFPLLPNQDEKNSSNIVDPAPQKEKSPSLISHNNYSSTTANSISSSNFPMESFSRPKLRTPNHINNSTKSHSSVAVNASIALSQCDDTSSALSPASIPVVESSTDDLLSTSLLALSQISSNIQYIDSPIMSQYDIDGQNLADPVDRLGGLPQDSSASSDGADDSSRNELLMFNCGGTNEEEVMNSQESFQSPNATTGTGAGVFHQEVPVLLSHEQPNVPEVSESSTACGDGFDTGVMTTDDAMKGDVCVEVEVDSSFGESSQVKATPGIECEAHILESKLFSPMCSQATATSKESSQATTPPSEVVDTSTSFVSTDDYENSTNAEEITSQLVETEVCVSTDGADGSQEDYNSFLSPESRARTAKESESDGHTGTDTAPYSDVSRTIGKNFSTVSDISISESASSSTDSVVGSPDTTRDAMTTSDSGERRSGIRTKGDSSSKDNTDSGVILRRRQSATSTRVPKSKRAEEECIERTPKSRNMSEVVETAPSTTGKRRRVDHGNEVSATSTLQDAAASSARTKRTPAPPKYAVLGSWPSSKQCAASGNWFIR